MTIDCEKLELACELATKFQQMHGSEGFDLRLNYSRSSLGIALITKSINYDFDSLDDLIQELQELTAKKPKFQVGDKVWRADGYDVVDFIIDTVDTEDGISYYAEGSSWWAEEDIFHSRLEVIKDQIDYWTHLKSIELSTSS